MRRYGIVAVHILVAIGCLVAIPILIGEACKSMDELNNQVTGETNPVYGDRGVAVIILKEKIMTRSILISEYYLISENNTFYACNYMDHYIDPRIGETYQIEWYYAGGYRIHNITQIKAGGDPT